MVALTLLILLPCLPLLHSSQEKEEVEEQVEECEASLDCSKELHAGQFLCLHKDVDVATQQLRDCRMVEGEGRAPVTCHALPGIQCSHSCNETFTRYESCNWTNGYHFDTALLLSVFLGMFGADRFYLGYPAIGLLKFSTLGFFFIGHLVDIILIASQALGPADGSHYIINYFGAGLSAVHVTDETVRRYQPEWN